MENKVSLTFSKEPAPGCYPQTDVSNPSIIFTQDPLYYYRPIYAQIIQAVSVVQTITSNHCKYFSSFPRVPPAPSISHSSISPLQYFVCIQNTELFTVQFSPVSYSFHPSFNCTDLAMNDHVSSFQFFLCLIKYRGPNTRSWRYSCTQLQIRH
jgi:hypothetical protein